MYSLGNAPNLTSQTYASPLAQLTGEGPPAPTSASVLATATGDGIGAGSPFQFGANSGSTGFPNSGAIASLMQTFNNFLQSLFSQLTSLFSGTPLGSAASNGAPGANALPIGTGPAEQYFTSARAGSVGDPHDSFEGTTAGGQAVGNRWNDMLAEPDLLCSDSFAGGYRVSTQVTAPNKDGVTHNSSATITTNNGNTTVTVNADGTTTIQSNGRNFSLTGTQTLNLGNGESVARDADGGVVVTMTNPAGGKIETTLTPHEGGVNVRASAENVDLGGYLVKPAPRSTTPSPGLPVPPLQQTPSAAFAPSSLAPLASAGTTPWLPPLSTAFASPAGSLGSGQDPFGQQFVT